MKRTLVVFVLIVVGFGTTGLLFAQTDEEHGRSNVELVLSDARSFRFPERAAGILSTCALPIIPNAQDVLERGERE
jgi:hypothetical protein